MSFCYFGSGFQIQERSSIFYDSGAIGSLPMMVSEKQHTHYLVTVTPYLSIAFSLILIRGETIISKLRESKYFRILLQDMEQFEEKLENGSTI